MQPQPQKQRGSAVCQSVDVPSQGKRLTAPGTFGHFLCLLFWDCNSQFCLFCLLNENVSRFEDCLSSYGYGEDETFLDKTEAIF